MVPADDGPEWAAQQSRLLQQRRKHVTRCAKGRAPELSPDLWVTLAFHCATVANLECEIGIPSFAEHPEVRDFHSSLYALIGQQSAVMHSSAPIPAAAPAYWLGLLHGLRCS